MALGEASAMGEMYDMIKTDVYSYALSKLGNKANAEDITQDTFLRVYENAARYQPQGKPMAWIFTVELNLIRRMYQLEKNPLSLDEAIETGAEDDEFERIVDNDLLRTVMRCLNSEEREVVSLHVVSGMKHREIAKLLGAPLSTVLSRYNRAIKKLQAAVKEGEE